MRAVSAPAAAAALLVAALALSARADIYLHSPRGQNDRCDETSNDRNNANRAFDSQNNAAGGYASCPVQMTFYENTDLLVEWMAQHSCGNGQTRKEDGTAPENTRCNIVIQLGCDFTLNDVTNMNYTYTGMTDGTPLVTPTVATGGSTCTQTRPTVADCATKTTDEAGCLAARQQIETGTDARGKFNSDSCACSAAKKSTYLLHESEEFYVKCKSRERNHGLFVADQGVRNDVGSTATRQNPNGDRYGFECAEERDYYPYWHPSPWIDLAVLTSNMSMCGYYQGNSQNVMPKGECTGSGAAMTSYWKYNNPDDCRANGGTWTTKQFNINPPDCLQAPYQVDNRLGNIAGTDASNPAGQMANYRWRIPSIVPSDRDSVTCTLRVRYNMSSSEVADNLDYRSNGKKVLANNPVVIAGDAASTDPLTALPVRLAINTAQYGRTFEDRTYSFKIARRPPQLATVNIHNLNVRGKRGNIAQVRNCVEYDFVPNMLKVKQGDYVHFQWCGSDFNNAGNTGEGLRQTDRSNVMPFGTATDNKPIGLGNLSALIFSMDDMRNLAWTNQPNCYNVSDMLTTKANSDQDLLSCHFLNGNMYNGSYSPYYARMVQVVGTGVFSYFSTRNNNFSNRSQKGTIVAANPYGLSAGAIAGIVIGSTVFVGAASAAAVFLVRRHRRQAVPSS